METFGHTLFAHKKGEGGKGFRGEKRWVRRMPEVHAAESSAVLKRKKGIGGDEK